jgi:hypothetical protein
LEKINAEVEINEKGVTLGVTATTAIEPESEPLIC